jgi:hypothetical protein
MSDSNMQDHDAFEAWARSIGKDDRDLQKTGSFGKLSYTWRTEQQMFEAYAAGMAAGREQCAVHLRASAARLAPDGKRTNKVDRHVADVLSTKATELSEVK